MTRRVTRKLFKNGGSLAIRIPKGWLPEDGEFELCVRDDGVLEVSPIDRDARMRRLLEKFRAENSIPDGEFPIPARAIEPQRFDWDELWNGRMPQ